MSGEPDAVCARLREDAAVALLSRRSLPADVRAHTTGCPSCEDELAGLAALTGLLGVLGGDQPPALPGAVEPSELLLPRLLAQVARRRRRRRWMTAAVAAAVVAVAVPVGVAVGRSDPAAIRSTGSPAGASAAPFSLGRGTDSQTGARAEVTVHGSDWGSRVEVEIYDVPGGTECRLVVVDRRGEEVEGGSWAVPAVGYTEGRTFPETVLTPPQDIVAVKIVDNRTERVMMRVPVAHR